MRVWCVAVVLVAWLAEVAAKEVIIPYHILNKDPCEDPNELPPRKRNVCNGNAILLWASKGKYRRVKHLLKQPDTAYLITYQEGRGWRKGYTALLWASEVNSTRTVVMLLDAGSIIDHRSYGDFTATYLLAENGNLPCLTRICQMGADTNVMTKVGYTPLFMATWNGHGKVVKVLLDHNANPNFTTPNSGYFPLYVASKNGRLDIVEHLLDAYANFNLQTSWGVTALHAATSWGHLDIVIALLAAGADTDIQEKDGYTPLHKATHYEFIDIVMALIDSGAEVDLQNKEGDSPLIHAAKKGNPELITLLVNATANPNLQENTGKTALHWAVINQKASCVKALLWSCPDLNIRDHDGLTAYDIAQYKVKYEVLQVFEGHDPSNCTMDSDFMGNDVY